MIDLQGNEIETHDQVVCVKPIDGYLTLNRVYRIQGCLDEQNRIILIDDNGREGWFNSNRFLVVVGRVTGEIV